MKANIVGYRAVASGYLYFCVAQSDSSSVTGEITLTVFSKNEHDIGNEILVYCRLIGGTYKYYELRKD